MKTNIWMPLFIGDYAGDTMHLTCEQHGAYMLLMMAYWRNNGPLQNDPKMLMTITKLTPAKWRKASVQVLRYFEVSNEFLVHKELESQLKIAREKSAQAVDAAKKRWSGGICHPPPPSPSQSFLVRVSDFEQPMEREAFEAEGKKLGAPKECVDWVWETHEARGWTDSQGQPVRNLVSVLKKTFTSWFPRKPKQPRSNGHTAAASTSKEVIIPRRL